MLKINRFVLLHLEAIEMVSVLTRISCFGLLSWMGPESPFGWVWAFNTLGAPLPFIARKWDTCVSNLCEISGRERKICEKILKSCYRKRCTYPRRGSRGKSVDCEFTGCSCRKS